MLDHIPANKEISTLLGKTAYQTWLKLTKEIDRLYEMEHKWNSWGKEWDYEYKYRRGGKTLCALYIKENALGCIIILGKDERAKYEEQRNNYSNRVNELYDDTPTLHDGKWLFFKNVDDQLIPELINLMAIKRKPNRK